MKTEEQIKDIQNVEESVIETPIEMSDENIAKVKEQIADEIIKESEIPDEKAEQFKKMLAEATMPVELTNAKFKLGDNELDIRSLDKKNQTQMFFRTLVLHSVYLKNITTSLIDIMRLVMILLDKLGVEDIVKSTDDIIEKIKEQNQLKEEPTEKN